MSSLRYKKDRIDLGDFNEYLDQKSRIYERNLHIKNMLRMQELMDEESFQKWKKLRFGGENPPVAGQDPEQTLGSAMRTKHSAGGKPSAHGLHR